MDVLLHWLHAHFIELAGAVLGLISIYLQILRKAAYWPVAIAMVIMYIYVFYTSRFYADMSFQVYYLIISVYGWWYWITHKNTSDNKHKGSDIQRLTPKGMTLALLVCIILFISIGLILYNFTDSDVVMGDAFTTAVSFVATWLLARKYLENWLFWIAADVVSTALYAYKGLYPTVILFSVLSVLAVIGYMKWKKELA